MSEAAAETEGDNVGISDAERSGARILAVLGGLGVVAASIARPATIDDGPVLCPFRRLTGLPCPLCGLTRSCVDLTHGDWEWALRANPFGFVVVAAAITLVLAVIRAALKDKPAPSLSRALASRPTRLILAAWLAFGIVRLVVVAVAKAGT